MSILKSYKYILEGLDCASCAKKIEDKIANINEYKEVSVNFATLKLAFKTDQKNPKKEITKLIKEIEPDVNVVEIDSDNKKANYDIFRLIIGISVYLIGLFIQYNFNIQIVLYAIAIATLLFRTAKKALVQIKKGIFDENALITISVIGACFVNKITEAVMVIALYEIGKILESRAINKTRRSISDLMDIKPEYANLKVGNNIKKVSPDTIKMGDIILIKTGEKIPLDGIIVKGKARIDTSAITGESILKEMQENEQIFSGSINVEGLIEVKVEKTYENSTVNQILNLVENATNKKAKTETFVAKVAKIYTPIVLGLALLVAIFMPILFKNITYSDSIYKALIFLVISCPCSIAISVPLSYFSGIGKASKKGILIKGSNYLDGINNISEIIFDKTGTITTGNFKISKINCIDESYTKEEIINYFAMGESFSNHPIAKSILKESNGKIDTKKVTNFEEISGKGLQYNYENKKIKIGNSDFVNYLYNKEENYGLSLYLKIDEKVIGNIFLTDEIKTKAKDVIKQLKKLNITTKMFTGDKKEIANIVAKEINIDSVKAQMLPQDKYKELEKSIELNTSNKNIAYVGDGINDSPVLARADIGISMGGIGSSSAIEASDIVIMTDELEKIIDAIQISKKTKKIIMENLTFSIGVKIIILILSLIGITDMWEAVFADVGTTLITIFNTLRILK